MTEFIIKYRWPIIVICLVLGTSLGSLIPFSKTDPEIRNYVPQNMKSRLETDKIEDEFGVQDMIVILFSDSTILSANNLMQIKNTDRDISKLSGVTSRISPFTVRTIRSTEGMMTADPLIGKIPSGSTEIAKLKEEILHNSFARDIVFSSDMTTASITVTINKSVPENITLQKIDSIINLYSGNTKVLTGGLPYIRKHIMNDVKKDALVLVPIALIIMLLVLKFTLGDWRSVFLPFSVVLITTAISMGLIPLLGWKLSIMSLLVPIILVAVANNYGIYLVARSQELSLKGGVSSGTDMLRELTGALNMPILFSGLTTIAGILGLLTHSIIPARQVGILAGTGVAAALIMSLFLIPAIIYMRPPIPATKRQAKIKSNGFQKLLKALSELIIRRPGRIILISVLVTLILSSGAVFLKIETNQEKYFPKKSPVRLASDVINKKFGGSQTISVMISGDIKDPVIMKSIDNLTGRLEKTKGVGKVFSISQAVREMSKAIYSPGETGYDQIPNTNEGIAQMFELYNMSGDPEDFRQLMNLENTRAHILIRLSNPENKVINVVKTLINQQTAGLPASVTVGGYAVIMADFAGLIIRGQISSLLFALLTVFILLTLIFRSFRGGMTGSIPLAVSILILFGFMGFAGIALDAATALLSSIMIGVGVDFTIQYIWCFNIHLIKGLTFEEATRSSMKTIGRSIFINAFSVMAGFSALVFSGFTSIRFFGYLVLISIGSCLAGAIILIPAILIRFKPRFILKDMRRKAGDRCRASGYREKNLLIKI